MDAPLKDAGVAGTQTASGLEDVRLSVVGDVAVLRGVVDEPRLQHEAARLAGAIDGVERVRNEIGLPSA